ncbi:MAG: DUF3329 domain-containing protein, partial [Gammaproteobacteria bacterium]|nr:DUF3329 domain-containing protein [Gammaproteobacteria bacterium]
MNFRNRAIAFLLAGAVAVLLLGWWQGHPAIFVAVYGLAIALWQIWQREHLAGWLSDQNENNLDGRWSQIAHLVSQKLGHEQSRNDNIEQQLGSFRDLAVSSPDGLVLLNRSWRIVWSNKAATDLLGLSQADYNRPINNLLRQPDFFEGLNDLNGLLTIDSPVDSRKTVSLQVVDISDNKRLLLAKDATAQRQAEVKRHDFVANASHELRSPLTVIQGYLDALADADIDSEWRKPVKEMLRQSRRMSHLLTDLMDLSRLDHMHLDANYDPI